MALNGHPPIWRAVCDLAAALHAGYWPMALDERWPGSDEVGQHVGVVSGDEIEAISRAMVACFRDALDARESVTLRLDR